MIDMTKVERINCPFCNNKDYSVWAEENGFFAVKCSECGLIYVNPRPLPHITSEAVKSGVHRNVNHGRTAISRRVGAKVKLYRKIISTIFADVWESKKLVSWLDVGAGYGEIIEAVTLLAPTGSKIEGIEPMRPKVIKAKKLGIQIKECFISEITEKYDFVSLINVFSHIPDFREFLKDIKKVLKLNGEFFLETGNIGELSNYRLVPSELDLPDHLVFASERNIIDYLNEAGFSIIAIHRRRKDGITNFLKNIIKKLLGRKVALRLPYQSPYRTLLIRSKLDK